jgi:hypothetical protein
MMEKSAPCQPKEETAATDDPNFDGQKPNEKGHHNPPFVEEQLQVQTCACCDEEQAQQDSTKWPDVRFNLAHN